jgi:hypothetical protein
MACRAVNLLCCADPRSPPFRTKAIFFHSSLSSFDEIITCGGSDMLIIRKNNKLLTTESVYDIIIS